MGIPSLWQEAYPGRPFPALAGDHRAEVCVIGAGVTGVSCAWRLLEHGVDVAVVDGRSAAGGASGRNGGFAVTGTELEPHELVERLGQDGARELHTATATALDSMIELAAELGVPEAVRRTGSVWVAGDDREAAEIETALAAAAEAGIDLRPAPELIPEPMRDRSRVAAFAAGAAELMPAAFVRALAAAAVERGATLYERSPAAGPRPDGRGWIVDAGAGRVHAQAVVVACDGLTPALLPELDGLVYPVRGQMLATAPLERVPLEFPTHCQFGFMYFRPTDDDRVVLGGGRLEQLEHEYTDREVTTAPVQTLLDGFLRDRLGLAGVPVAHRWAGIMGFSADLLPVAGPVPERPGVYAAGGYSGLGNVLGHLCGGLLADLIVTGTHPQAAAFAPQRFDRSRPVEQLEKARSRELAATIFRKL